MEKAINSKRHIKSNHNNKKVGDIISRQTQKTYLLKKQSETNNIQAVTQKNSLKPLSNNSNQ